MKKSIYISYDGALDPLGQSQIIPYLKGLSNKGHQIILVTYEKKERLSQQHELSKLVSDLTKNNIRWIKLTYHKRPSALATLYDIIVGTITLLSIILKENILIIHARSFIGALPALIVKSIFKNKISFIFDIRGFWPEERVDGNIFSKTSMMFKVSKKLEEMIINQSNQIIVLTKRAKEILQNKYPKICPISVIPTCVNTDLFSNKSTLPISTYLDNREIYTYLGSLGTWYCFDEMVQFFQILLKRKPSAFFLIITPYKLDFANEEFITKNLGKDHYLQISLPHHEIPNWLQKSQFTISFIRPTYSKISSCPTKFGESLSCGVPVITNRGIGDCDLIVEKYKTGVLIDEFSIENYIKAVDELIKLQEDPDLGRRCKQTAESLFSLKGAINSYDTIYNSCLANNSPL